MTDRNYENDNSILKNYSYSMITILDLYLKFVCGEIYKYSPIRDIFRENMEKLFKWERERKQTFYNDVIAYGEVQSGKTANMLAASICAYDLGFRYVFILTGNIENLHNQTVDRFKKNLRDFKKHLGRNLFLKIYNLQNYNNVIQFLAINPSLDSNLNVFFSLKNATNYEKIMKILQTTNFKRGNGRNGVLIIDDEADWGNKSDFHSENERKSLYDKLLSIKNLSARDHLFYLKYMAFTATPYKLLTVNNQELVSGKNVVLLKSKTIEPWMSQEYILENQPFYFGGAAFQANETQEYSRFKDSVLGSALNRSFITEFDENYVEDVDEIWLLKLSIYMFLINTYLYKKSVNQFNSNEKIVGLYFTDIYKSTHNQQFNCLIQLLPQLKKETELLISYFNGSDEREWGARKEEHIKKIIDVLIAENHFSISPLRELIRNKFSRISSLIKLKALFKFMADWLDESITSPNRFIIKMSGEEEENNKLQNKENKSYLNAYFIIGGYKLSRGVTFDNLVYQCLIKKSEKHDSTLQRARWFGFRRLELLANMDLILSKNVKDKFFETIEFDRRVRSLFSH